VCEIDRLQYWQIDRIKLVVLSLKHWHISKDFWWRRLALRLPFYQCKHGSGDKFSEWIFRLKPAVFSDRSYGIFEWIFRVKLCKHHSVRSSCVSLTHSLSSLWSAISHNQHVCTPTFYLNTPTFFYEELVCSENSNVPDNLNWTLVSEYWCLNSCETEY
jgi:hypothetical protein